jgi:hypothetical protein
MLHIKTVINGVTHTLPDPILERMDKRLKKIRNYLIVMFKPVTDNYPDADIFIQWKDENGKADVTYVSSSTTIEEMNNLLNKDRTDRFSQGLS